MKNWRKKNHKLFRIIRVFNDHEDKNQKEVCETHQQNFEEDSKVRIIKV